MRRYAAAARTSVGRDAVASDSIRQGHQRLILSKDEERSESGLACSFDGITALDQPYCGQGCATGAEKETRDGVGCLDHVDSHRRRGLRTAYDLVVTRWHAAGVRSR